MEEIRGVTLAVLLGLMILLSVACGALIEATADESDMMTWEELNNGTK